MSLLAILLFSCLLSCKKEAYYTMPEQEKTQSNIATGDEFTIVVLPDTQYYTRDNKTAGSLTMLSDQISWIRSNAISANIAYVIHVGDIVDKSDSTYMWVNAKNSLYQLEDPLIGYPNGIPYGVCVGNHDQKPAENPVGTTPGFDQYFGVAHFQNKSYYGGHYDSDNDNHYDLFSNKGTDYIVIYLEFNRYPDPNSGPLLWAYNLLGTYASKKAIIVTHYLLNNNGTAGTNSGSPATFGPQAQILYDKIKSRPNVFMMVGGHIGDNGEGYRQDVYNGNTIKSYLSDYQSRILGGDGYLRIMKFSVINDRVSIKTYSPFRNYLNQFPFYETDGDSEFTKPMFH